MCVYVHVCTLRCVHACTCVYCSVKYQYCICTVLSAFSAGPLFMCVCVCVCVQGGVAYVRHTEQGRSHEDVRGRTQDGKAERGVA